MFAATDLATKRSSREQTLALPTRGTLAQESWVTQPIQAGRDRQHQRNRSPRHEIKNVDNPTWREDQSAS